MDHEGHALSAFVASAKRLAANFHPDGRAMATKLAHLKLLLRHADPDFYQYLQEAGADDLFSVTAGPLLELGAEVCLFDDASRMLEVTWSSHPDPPGEVELGGPPALVVDMGFRGPPGRPMRQRHMLRPAGGGGGAFEDAAVDHLTTSSARGLVAGGVS